MCLFRRYLGIRCPGCGYTTASRLAARGRIAQALHVYPAWPIVTAYLVESGRRAAVSAPPLRGAAGSAALATAMLPWVAGLARDRRRSVSRRRRRR